MLRTKPLADALTAMRFSLGIMLAWLGTRAEEATLPLAVTLLLAAWISDALDGPLARRDVQHAATWIGDHDLTADVMVAIGVWLYLGLTSFIKLELMLGYALLAALTWWWTGSLHVGWGIQAIPYAAMIWTALRAAPSYGWLLVLYLALLITVTWPRPLDKATEFIQGILATIKP